MFVRGFDGTDGTNEYLVGRPLRMQVRSGGGRAAVFDKPGVLEIQHKRGIENIDCYKKRLIKDEQTVVPGEEMASRELHISRSKISYPVCLRYLDKLAFRLKTTVWRV